MEQFRGLQSFCFDFFAGGFSGALAKTIVYPNERIKLILTNHELKVRPCTGMWNCFKGVLIEQGVLSLWKGNKAIVVRYFPLEAINFSLKDLLYRNFLNPLEAKQQHAKYFAGSLFIGGLAGCISLLIVFPFNYNRIKFEFEFGKPKNHIRFTRLINCLNQIVKPNGLVEIYQGFGIQLVWTFVYRALYFGGYDAGMRAIWDDAAQSNSSQIAKFFFAYFVVIASQTIAYPFETVSRRLMLYARMKDNMNFQAYQYLNIKVIDCFLSIYTKEGIGAFFKGNLSSTSKSIKSSLILVIYDEFQKLFANKGKN